MHIMNHIRFNDCRDGSEYVLCNFRPELGGSQCQDEDSIETLKPQKISEQNYGLW